ncbi:MAG: magnesium/cobalt transporter CorA [Candidatus Cloacimonadota bacterium]|nr:magnesium/cobalt transporter CorA [Candidatus Cloacimonadota bacterium]
MKKIRSNFNTIPGTIDYTGKTKQNTPVLIKNIAYNEKEFQEEEINALDNFQFEPQKNNWLDIIGVHNSQILDKAGKKFQIHPLSLEDIANVNQRPKFEIFENYIFFVFRMLQLEDDYNLISEQFSIILTNQSIISFQEKEGDIFDNLRDRIRNSRGRIRQKGIDYLAFSLMDAIVDNYFFILEKLNDRMEDLEDRALQKPDNATLQEIHKLKRVIISLRKSIWPIRDILNRLYKDEEDYFEDSTQLYLRDLYDHSLQVIESIETYREIINGILEIYMSTVSNRMNEVMKMLTIIATIFIPLTFIAGVYGMNFKFMPELKLTWGYPAVLGIMAIVTIIMIVYFKKKKWL